MLAPAEAKRLERLHTSFHVVRHLTRPRAAAILEGFRLAFHRTKADNKGGEIVDGHLEDLLGDDLVLLGVSDFVWNPKPKIATEMAETLADLFGDVVLTSGGDIVGGFVWNPKLLIETEMAETLEDLFGGVVRTSGGDIGCDFVWNPKPLFFDVEVAHNNDDTAELKVVVPPWPFDELGKEKKDKKDQADVTTSLPIPPGPLPTVGAKEKGQGKGREWEERQEG